MSNTYTKTVNLDIFSDIEKEIMKKHKVEFNQKISKIVKESRNASKLSKCYYCNNECDGFCNSHSVPSFCLKNIATSGEVLTIGEFLNIPIVNGKKGVNQAGTFHLICRDCDSKIFSDYENPDNYGTPPTPKMIAQIALKNNLKYISKRFLENKMYDNMAENFNLPEAINSVKHYINDLDLKEYILGFNKAKRALSKGWNDEYYVCFYKKLSYVVPIAFQSCVSLLYDFENNIINDLYNSSPDYLIKQLNICVFPLKNETVIIMFVDNEDKRYRKFYKQFNKLSLEEQLSSLTFIMFAYTEDVFISDSLIPTIRKNPHLIEASQADPVIMSTTPLFNPHEAAKKVYDLSKRKEIPNLLSEEYKLK